MKSDLKKEIKEEIIEILSYIPRGKISTMEELWNKEADKILELFEQKKKKWVKALIKKIDEVYKKEGGIHHWKDLREELRKVGRII